MEIVRNWLVELTVRAIESCSSEQDRIEIVAWLAVVRESVAREGSTIEKVRHVYRLVDSKKTVGIVFRSVLESVKNYRDAKLPLPVKIAMPAALAAVAVIGGQGAGLAALGGAVGLPVVLVVFLGVAGLTSVIEAFIKEPAARKYVTIITYLILHDELLRRQRKDLREAMAGNVVAPEKANVRDKDEEALRAALFAMDPYEFERHVMSFFQDAGFLAWVTKKSNDFGIDGFARHPKGLICVQCKRNAPANAVGRPEVDQFKGAIEPHEDCVIAYIVTTSRFTKEAQDSGSLNAKIRLVDMDELIRWHSSFTVG